MSTDDKRWKLALKAGFQIVIACVIGLIHDLTFDNVLPQLISINILDITGDIVFLLAPLGLFYSSYIIIKGYEAWLSNIIIFMTILYLLIGIVLLSNGCTSDSISCGLSLNYYEVTDITRGLFNLVITIPLGLSLYYFGKLFSRMKLPNKNSIILLETGIGVGTVGQIYNSAFILLGQGTQILGLLIIVVGVFFAALSFSNIFAEKIEIK